MLLCSIYDILMYLLPNINLLKKVILLHSKNVVKNNVNFSYIYIFFIILFVYFYIFVFIYIYIDLHINILS